jgi:fatty-acyl-CoA synthase
MNVAELLLESARSHPRNVAVDDGRRSATFGELAQRARELAAGLSALPIARGERVAVLSKNRAEYLELYCACALIGAVCVPLNWRLRTNELEDIVEDSSACALFVEEELASGRDDLGSGCTRLRERFVIGTSRAGWRSSTELHAHGAVAAPLAVAPDEVAIQMYTSGTTGRPKGAMLTHGNVAAMVASWLEEMPLVAGRDMFLQVTPLFHVGGMLMAFSCMSAGVELLLHPEFFPRPAADALATRAVTHALFVPAMLQWMLDEPGVAQMRFPRLALIVYGAAPMPRALLQRAIDVFGCAFLQGYGLTESTGVLTVLRPADHVEALRDADWGRLSSAGRAVSCCEVRLVDEHDQEVPPGTVGEIVARGANVSPGYWNMPRESEEALRGGWFHTGDLATRDPHGFVAIVDRSKDMILVGGENVYPREIEDVLRAHPAVADAAVIGIPHETWGEEVLAVVVTRAQATDRELVQHCRAQLARFKCPTRVEFRDELPRNSAGKLQKELLREPWWKGRERRV